MTFFLDNCISPRFAGALRCLEEDVKALREEFPQETPDSDWIAALGEKGWVLVTADRRILTRPQESLALKTAQVTTFFLGPFFSKKLKFWDQAVWMVRHWPALKSMARTIARGTCFRVQQNGKMRPI